MTTKTQTLRETVDKALVRAYSLGQTYWQQADSDYISHNRKSDETQARFDAMRAETVAALDSDVARRKDMFDMVINSVAAALERAGVNDVDDPGEAIDVLVADKDAEIARLRGTLESIAAYPHARDQEMGVVAMRKIAREALNKD